MSHRLAVPPVPIETDSVVYDVSRLVRNVGEPFATGIDRIDLAIARDLSRRFADRCMFVHAKLGGPAILPQEVGEALLDHLDAVWHQGNTAPPPIPRGAALRSRVLGALRRPRLDAEQTTYVVASHTGLFRYPGAIERLDPAGMMRRLVYLHDLIPLEYPEYQTPASVRKFATFLREALAGRVQIVTNTEDTAARVLAHASSRGLDIACPIVCRPTLAETTPPYDRKLDPSLAEVFAAERPVFLMVGTIEPRKNHLLILKIWQELAKGEQAPHLLLLGKRGWMCEAPVALLDDCTELAQFVTEISNLGDDEVAAAMRNARALLFPSFAEGLGLPVLEAAAAGLPVIASDLAAVREIAAVGTVFLDPEDKEGWNAAILAAAIGPQIHPPDDGT